MSRKGRGVRPAESPAAAASDDGALPRAGTLGALVALGAVAALWAAVLWRELLKVRGGLDSAVCPASGEGGCAALWDAPFARAVESASGVTVAGWGVAWGIAAAIAPALVLAFARSRPPVATLWVTATRIVAAAGVVAVLALLGVSASAGSFCRGCLGTYVVVGAYAAIALFAWRAFGLPSLVPAGVGALALAAAAVVTVRALAPADPSLLPATPAVTASAPAPPLAAGSPGAMLMRGDPQVAALVDGLAPPVQQGLSDALHIYRTGNSTALPPARRLAGAESAPVRVTTFSDFLCGHCATLHRTLDEIGSRVPPGRISVEARHYPLDGRCNPNIPRPQPDDVRCVAAKAALCLESHEKADEFRGRLYAQQASLTSAAVLSAARDYMPAPQLQACLADMTTDRWLREDIALASRYHIDGTPLVLVNGRQATSYPPFLLAIALTGGRDDDPAFGRLPPPRPDAHMH